MVGFCDFVKDKKTKKQVKELYKKAFPLNERLPFIILCRKAKSKKGEFFAVKDNTEFIGLVYTVTNKDVVYLFFLAVKPEARGKGYGSEILQQLKTMYVGKRIILNIEELNPSAENYSERIKRKEFYGRNGFELANIKSSEAGVIYDLMVCGGAVCYDDYAKLIKFFAGSTPYKLFYREIKK